MKIDRRLISVIALNLIPIFGVVFLSWDLFFIMYLYSLEVYALMFYFFLSSVRHYWNDTIRKSEAIFIVTVIAVVCAGVVLVWAAIPLDFLMHHSPKTSIIHSDEYISVLDVLYQSLNKYTIVPLLVFFVVHGVNFFTEKNRADEALQINAVRFFGREVLLLSVLFIGYLLQVFLRLPLALFSVFVVLKMIPEYILFDKSIIERFD